jgi:hypothetical protein
LWRQSHSHAYDRHRDAADPHADSDPHADQNAHTDLDADANPNANANPNSDAGVTQTLSAAALAEGIGETNPCPTRSFISD